MDLDFVKNAMISRFRFDPIHWLIVLGRQFWVHPDDFCKNAGFAGFGSMDLRVIAASVREFRR